MATAGGYRHGHRSERRERGGDPAAVRSHCVTTSANCALFSSKWVDAEHLRHAPQRPPDIAWLPIAGVGVEVVPGLPAEFERAPAAVIGQVELAIGPHRVEQVARRGLLEGEHGPLLGVE